MSVKQRGKGDSPEVAEVLKFQHEKIDMPKCLFRYHTKSNETAIIEKMIADYVGAKYCIAVNSCSSAMFIALMTQNNLKGMRVGFPVFTFTAVPSAIQHAGGIPVPVNCTDEYYIDTEDLERVIEDKQLNYLMLSYMRGHFPEVDRVMEICDAHGVVVIEDCAHALGVKYRGRFLGTFGAIGCYSSQSAKIINSGEGGFIVTDDEDTAAKAIMMAGSYEGLWENHIARPDDKTMIKHQNYQPCYGLRMHNLTASLLIRQLKDLEETILHVNENYANLCQMLHMYDRFITIPGFPDNSRPVFDTMQFRLNSMDVDKFFKKTGIEYFAMPDNARAYWNWGYLGMTKGLFPNIDKLLANSMDLRLPARYNEGDIVRIFDKIGEAIDG